MPTKRQLGAITAVVVALLAVASNFQTRGGPTSRTSAVAERTSTKAGRATENAASNRSDTRLRKIGFRSEEKLRQHFEKHGKEFGQISQSDYLAMAQDLRDAPLSKSVLEAQQSNGALSRFDRRDGSFLAFDRNLTIRTFFRPDGGEAYFWRAAKRRQ